MWTIAEAIYWPWLLWALALCWGLLVRWRSRFTVNRYRRDLQRSSQPASGASACICHVRRRLEVEPLRAIDEDWTEFRERMAGYRALDLKYGQGANRVGRRDAPGPPADSGPVP